MRPMFLFACELMSDLRRATFYRAACGRPHAGRGKRKRERKGGAATACDVGAKKPPAGSGRVVEAELFREKILKRSDEEPGQQGRHKQCAEHLKKGCSPYGQ